MGPRLVFVLAGGHAGVFFKGFIKSGHGFEADVIGNGLDFHVLSFGIGHDLFGFFYAVEVDVIEKLSFYHVIEQLGELVVGYRKERDFSEEALSHMPLFFLARALTWLGWTFTRYETETAQEMRPLVIEMACDLSEGYLSAG